jgi:hypothetical protein
MTTAAGVCHGRIRARHQIPTSSINPIAAEYIKDIYAKLPLSATNTVSATTSESFPVQNIYNSRQEIARIDHTFNEKFSVWGKFENDSIPTTEPGGLFTGAAIPYMATTSTNSPGQAYVVHAIYSITPDPAERPQFQLHAQRHSLHAGGSRRQGNSPDINVPEPYTNTQGVIPTVASPADRASSATARTTSSTRITTCYDSITWIRGRHTLKFGYSMNRYNKTENAASDQGTFSFSNAGAPYRHQFLPAVVREFPAGQRGQLHPALRGHHSQSLGLAA